MRRILFILFIVVSFNLVSGQVLANNIVIINEQGKKFTLYVNDEKVNIAPQSNVKAFGLEGGLQKIKIEFEDNSPAIIDSIIIKPIDKNRNKEFTYAIREASKNGKQGKGLVFISVGDLSGPESPVVPEVPVYVDVKDNKLYGNLYQAKDNKPVFISNYNEENKKCIVSLDDQDIQFAVSLVKKSNDLVNKFNYVKETVEKNCYSTSQLIELLNLLEIELDKLKLAKVAYTHLTDQQNADKVLEAFKYKTFKDDYTNFLKELKNARQQEALNCTVPISENEFRAIYAQIKKTPYEYNKLILAKKEAVKHCLNTGQVKQILDIFTHDREKMEFVKASYAVVTDKSNLSSLEDSFQFSESKTEFKKIISR